MRRIFVILGFLALGVGGGKADALWNQKIAAWHTGAYTRAGQFSHCAATASYRSGILLALSINKSFRWSMALINPAWNLRLGSKYQISYNVDLTEPQFGTAIAIGSHVAEVYLADSAELFKAFKMGKTLYVQAQAANFQFNLTDSSRVLDYLAECVKNGGAKPQIATANPFGTSKVETAASASSRSTEAIRTEALTFAANLVSTLGVSNFIFYKQEEVPDFLPADAAWKSPFGLGGVGIFPKLPNAGILSANLLKIDASGCKKAFASGTLPSEGDGNFHQLFTKCGTGNDAIVSYYIIAPRAAGGSYVITTVSKGSVASDKSPKVDDDVRSATFKVLSNWK